MTKTPPTLTATEIRRRQREYIRSEPFQRLVRLAKESGIPYGIWERLFARLNEPKGKR